MRALGLALVVSVSVFLFGCNNADAGGADGGTVFVAGELTSDSTWAASSADCDVTVTADVTVKGNLTIAAGVKVCFQADTGLIVDKAGSLHATGTAAARITMTGTSATRGYWKGVAFWSNNMLNTLQYVDVSYAGSNTPFCCSTSLGDEQIKAAVLVGDNSTAALVSIQNSSISNSGAIGLIAFESSRLTGFATNTFANNVGVPVAVSLIAVNDLDSASVYSGGAMANGTNSVRVVQYGSPLTTAVTVKKLDVPYSMSLAAADKVFEIASVLTISAGVRMEFEANSGVLIAAAGRLASNGTSTQRVTLTGRSMTPGFWKGVAILSVANTLTSTDLSYGGGDESFCCGFFEATTGNPATKAALVIGDSSVSAGATVSDVKITQSKNRGVSVLGGTLTQSGTNDLATGNGLPNLL